MNNVEYLVENYKMCNFYKVDNNTGDVLHVNTSSLCINRLYISDLAISGGKFKNITEDEFNEQLRYTILDLDIWKFVVSK
jgi:hypothetical protein